MKPANRSRNGSAAQLVVLLLAGGVLAVACRKGDTDDPAPSRGAAPAGRTSTRSLAPSVDASILVASPKVTPGGLPERFEAALPASEADLRNPDKHPPLPWVSAALASGDAAMRGKLLDAVRRASAGGAVPETLASYYRELFGYPPNTAECDWIRSVATGGEPATARAVFFHALAGCVGSRHAEAFARAEAPDDAVIEWYVGQDDAGDRPPLTERLLSAARAEVASGNPRLLRRVGFALACAGGLESLAAVQDLQAQLGDPKSRAQLAIGLLRHPAPEARALGRKACDILPDDAMCARVDEPGGAEPVAALSALDDAVRGSESLQELSARFPREQVIAALERCLAEERSGFSRPLCLSRLAMIDRAKAVASARALAGRGRPDRDDGGLERIVRTLAAFPEEGALELRLAELGFTHAAPDPHVDAGTDNVEGVTAEAALTRLGRATSFDAETDQFPNEHDRLLYNLARSARPELDGVVFEEVPPPESGEGPYLLRAYMEGQRYEVPAVNHGDWYDVEAVIGLLNALAIARRSEWRFVTLATGDQSATVVAGPVSGIRALAEAGLIETVRPGAAMQSGKDFEQQVFEQLTKDGELPASGSAIGE